MVGSVAAQWLGAYGSRVQMSQALASDYWNLYQARSVKGHLLEVTTNVLAKAGNSSDPEIQKMLKEYGKEVARYDQGKEESQKIAKAYEEAPRRRRGFGKEIGAVASAFLGVHRDGLNVFVDEKEAVMAGGHPGGRFRHSHHGVNAPGRGSAQRSRGC